MHQPSTLAQLQQQCQVPRLLLPLVLPPPQLLLLQQLHRLHPHPPRLLLLHPAATPPAAAAAAVTTAAAKMAAEVVAVTAVLAVTAATAVAAVTAGGGKPSSAPAAARRRLHAAKSAGAPEAALLVPTAAAPETAAFGPDGLPQAEAPVSGDSAPGKGIGIGTLDEFTKTSSVYNPQGLEYDAVCALCWCSCTLQLDNTDVLGTSWPLVALHVHMYMCEGQHSVTCKPDASQV